MPAIGSDRLVDLHNDLTHYDTMIAKELREFLRGQPVNPARLQVDAELEETLRSFKAETAAEVECRRDMLRYKRRVDDVATDVAMTFRLEAFVAHDDVMPETCFVDGAFAVDVGGAD